jgi:hypothetical protein
MNNIVLSFVLKRLQEPSTYNGLGGLLASMHFTGVTPDQLHAVSAALMAIFFALGTFMSEAKKA